MHAIRGGRRDRALTLLARRRGHDLLSRYRPLLPWGRRVLRGQRGGRASRRRARPSAVPLGHVPLRGVELAQQVRGGRRLRLGRREEDRGRRRARGARLRLLPRRLLRGGAVRGRASLCGSPRGGALARLMQHVAHVVQARGALLRLLGRSQAAVLRRLPRARPPVQRSELARPLRHGRGMLMVMIMLHQSFLPPSLVVAVATRTARHVSRPRFHPRPSDTPHPRSGWDTSRWQHTTSPLLSAMTLLSPGRVCEKSMTCSGTLSRDARPSPAHRAPAHRAAGTAAARSAAQ